MKIIGGKYGGRRLIVPKNRDIRPTSDKVRGAIFNMLASRGAIEEAHVLDAFCGTGALGLEALSRGAKTCEFIDKSRTSLTLARENAEILGVDPMPTYSLGDAKKVFATRERYESVQSISKENDTVSECEKNKAKTYGKTTDAYNLVFLDPPYHMNLINEIVPILIDAKCLYDNTWIVCESERNFSMQENETTRIDSEKQYGETKVILLQYSGTYGKR